MCGIAGTVSTGRPDPDRMRRMCELLVHRGPDGHGEHVDDHAALGMRRLAIIDLTGGGQPVYNEDRSVVAVFNGELYNFADLRAELTGKGHRVTSTGDSECLVHLYEEYGDELVHRLRGMFAFAIWDARRGRLLLARDRVGKKPVYWREHGGELTFASEAAALLADPTVPRRLDPLALHHYLTFQYVPAPWSIYQGVHKLPPGHLLTWQDGSFTVRRYWAVDSTPAPVTDERAAAAQLRDLLLDAVRVRMVSERPLGAFLSGGVDSSAVVAAMAQQSPVPVRTFSIGFDDDRFDERRYARLVAQRYATDHHELVVTGSVVELLPTLAQHFGEPFADSSAIPSFFVAQLSRAEVTVALNGDGGDECFGGYERYLAMRALARVPALRPRRLFESVGGALAGHAAPRSTRRRLGRAVQLLGQDPCARYATLMSVFSPALKRELYTPELAAELSDVDSWAIADEAYARSTATDLLGRIIDTDIATYLPGDLLAKVDITTMANSLEARSPFLDHHLMAWAARLPPALKVRGTTTKYLLKEAVRPWLPASVIDRPKMGFGVPLAGWLRGELRDLAWSVLTDDTARGRGLFRPETVTAMLRRHEAGVDESHRLWALIQFELWHRRFLDPPLPDVPPVSAALVADRR